MNCPTITLFVSTLVQLIHHLESEEAFCSNKCLNDGDIALRSCYCDEFCWKLYNDCCADAPVPSSLQWKTIAPKRSGIVCKTFAQNLSSYIITGCNPDWIGPSAIATQCQQLQKESKDPVGTGPLTNYRNGITYANYYCALCNDDTGNLLFWDIRVSCPFNPNALMDEDEPMQYIIYNQLQKEWGYLIRDEPNDRTSFYGCTITYQTSRSVLKSIRHCYPDEINSCLHSWKNDVIKDMCRSYSDSVFSNGTRYKNFYCAICNRVDHSHISCTGGIGYRSDISGGTETADPTSFSLLLDVNLSEGNRVGKRTVPVSCRKGEIFDPFAKKCRNVVCGIPGYVLREGRCTLESRQQPIP